MYPLDTKIQEHASRLAILPRKCKAIFFASCAERLFPLCIAFSIATGWKYQNQLREILDQVWQCLVADALPAWEPTLKELETEYMPHSDDYDVLECTYTQDIAICISTSIRCLSEDYLAAPDSLGYVFEVFRVTICDEKFGYSYLPPSPTADEFEGGLSSDNRIRNELAYQQLDLSDLETGASRDVRAINRIKERSQSHGWNVQRMKNSN